MIGKGRWQGCILSPYLFNLYTEHIMRRAGLDDSKAGVKIAGRNINNLIYADNITLMAKSEEELRSLITRVKEESAKAGLQLNIKKTKIMATTPIDNWQMEGENVEAVTDLIFPGVNITADADCSQEIRRRLLLGRRAMAILDKIVKSRDITLAMKVRIVKAMVFPIVTYGCESWTIRKAEQRKIDAFELWRWRKILRVPWTARRSNQSIIQEIMPGCSLEGRILEAKLKYLGHIMRRQERLEKIMMMGKMEGKRKRGQPRARWIDGILEVTGLTLKELGVATADRELWRGLVGSSCGPRRSQNFPPTPHFKSIYLPSLSLPYGPALTSIAYYGEYHCLHYLDLRCQCDVSTLH
uniref:ribonuclease H n=1 Tax=Anolis carolinensis TaxID=28377 RepID=A0A803TQF5_ANOCA